MIKFVLLVTDQLRGRDGSSKFALKDGEKLSQLCLFGKGPGHFFLMVEAYFLNFLH